MTERKAIPPRNNTSGYVGVTLDSRSYKWRAQIKDKDNKACFIGRFDDKEEAARAYDKKAREMFGDNARVNFPKGRE